jgi:hypothetical protein
MSNQQELDKLSKEIEQSLTTLKQIIEDLNYLNKSTKKWMITKERKKQV